MSEEENKNIIGSAGPATAKFISRKSATETCLGFFNFIPSFKEVYDGVETEQASWKTTYTCKDLPQFPWGIVIGVVVVAVVAGIVGFVCCKKKKNAEGRIPLVNNA